MKKVRITDIHEKDRYYKVKDRTVGRVMTLRDDVREVVDSAFYPGWKEALCVSESGDTMFFVAVRYEEVKGNE